MTEWANDLVGRKRALLEQERIRTEWLLHEAREVEARAAAEWMRLKDLVRDAADEVNRQWGDTALTVEEPGPNALEVKAAGRARALASLRFNPAAREIRGDFHGCEARLSLDRDGELAWQSTCDSAARWTSRRIAQRIIERAWQDYR